MEKGKEDLAEEKNRGLGVDGETKRNGRNKK